MAQLAAPLTIASTLMSYKQSNDQAKRQYEQTRLDAEAKKRQYERDKKKQMRQRKAAQASARAKFASQGRGAADGSAQALLNGLNQRYRQSTTELAEDYNHGVNRSLLHDDRRKSNLEQLFGIGNSFSKYF